MGRRGPAPRPTALKLLGGETRRSRVNYAEPELPAPGVMDPPAGLTGAGRAEWLRLLPVLIDAGVVTDGDLGHFGDYCKAMSDLHRFETKAAKVGIEKAIAKGFANQILKLRTQLVSLRAHLGLTPSSRTGVHAKRKPTSNLAKFLERTSPRKIGNG